MNQNNNDLLFHELVVMHLEEIQRLYGLNLNLNKSKACLTNVVKRMVESLKDEVEHF